MDEFKKYVRSNREEFDVYQPDDSVWEKIASAAGKPKPKKYPVFWMAAAAITAVLITLAIFYPDQKATDKTIVKTVAQPEIQKKPTGSILKDSVNPVVIKEIIAKKSSLSPGKKDSKATVPELVDSEIRRLEKMAVYAENPRYLNAYRTQLQNMEAHERSLKADIARYGMNDRFLEQLINVNQRKLKLLKDLQNEINKINTRGTQNKKKIKPYYLQL